LEFRQHQTTDREANVAIQHAELLRDHSLRDSFERLLQLASGRRSIVSNNHLEILTTADTASRVVLQQHSGFLMYPAGCDDDEVRCFSVDLVIDRPARERGGQIAVTGHDQKRFATDVRH